MGLDMYLEARCPIAPGDPALAPVRKAIGDAIGYTPPEEKPDNDPELMEVSAVVVRVGYWRKLHPLHLWFVNNVQEGNDDCRPAFVNPNTLEELEELLDEVDDDPDCAGNHFEVENGETLDEDDVDYTLRMIVQARKLQQRGWDIYYRSSW